jgi:opacity protein-like surface antigen
MQLSRLSLAALALCAAPLRADSELPPDPATGSGEGAAYAAPATSRAGGSSSSASGGSGIGFRRWGLRVGVADDPDQVVGGAHFDLGEFVRRLRFQPDVQLGFGDDHTTLFFTAPAHYHFDTDTSFTPYAGGGIAVGFVDHDNPGPGNDESEFEVGGRVTGGLEWPMSGGRAFLVELNLGLGDVHDVAVIAGWTF